MTVTEQERQRRSDWAKQAHRTGKLDAKVDGAKGGRNRKSVGRTVHDLVERVLDLPDAEKFRALGEISAVIDSAESRLNGRSQ